MNQQRYALALSTSFGNFLCKAFTKLTKPSELFYNVITHIVVHPINYLAKALTFIKSYKNFFVVRIDFCFSENGINILLNNKLNEQELEQVNGGQNIMPVIFAGTKETDEQILTIDNINVSKSSEVAAKYIPDSTLDYLK